MSTGFPVIHLSGSTYSVGIYLDDSLTYSDDSLTLTEISTLDVQSHWGSGVIFSNLEIINMEP